MRCHVRIAVGLGLLAMPIQAQDETAGPQQIFESIQGARPRPTGSRPIREESMKAAAATKAAAQEALVEHAALFAEGEGLYWKAKLQRLARAEPELVAGTFLAHAQAQPDSELAAESFLEAAQYASGPGRSREEARRLLAQVQVGKLTPPNQKRYDMLKDGIEAAGKRDQLAGKPAPEIAADHVVGGAADFSLAALAAATVLGVLFTGLVEPLAEHGLALAGGVTLYVGASNLVPEFQAKPGWRLPFAFFAGCGIYLLARQMLPG